jgi:hypothetical protein
MKRTGTLFAVGILFSTQVLAQAPKYILADTLIKSNSSSIIVENYHYDANYKLLSVRYKDLSNFMIQATDSIFYNVNSVDVDSVVRYYANHSSYTKSKFSYTNGRLTKTVRIEMDSSNKLRASIQTYTYTPNGQVKKIAQVDTSGEGNLDSLTHAVSSNGDIDSGWVYLSGQGVGIPTVVEHANELNREYWFLSNDFIFYFSKHYPTVVYPVATPNTHFVNNVYTFDQDGYLLTWDQNDKGSSDFTTIKRTWGTQITTDLPISLMNGNQVAISPNPSADGKMTLSLPESAHVAIFNFAGTKLGELNYQAGTHLLEIPSAVSGMYILTIQSPSGNQNLKVIVK